MLNLKSIEAIVDQLIATLPAGLNSLPQNLKNNFKVILTDSLKNLDLVPREEFDTQLAILRKNRKLLEKLEQRISELEAKQDNQ